MDCNVYKSLITLTFFYKKVPPHEQELLSERSESYHAYPEHVRLERILNVHLQALK